MREILFRGKQTTDGEWITGYLVSASHIGDWVEANPVDPATVGQFTGLTDKNGKKIFEGDIVISTNPRRLSSKPTVVEFSPYSGYWNCAEARNPVVVGNIHDNPKLLEVRK